MNGKLLIWIGSIGSLIAGVCCLTPILPIILGSIGASSLLGFMYRDIILLPLLAVFLCILAIGIVRQRHGH